uniref:Uncharacterized protein n=1 Tax=Rhizophora mucronata TaxID=61149 RepID=A0A2P2NVK2_RHIMU
MRIIDVCCSSECRLRRIDFPSMVYRFVIYESGKPPLDSQTPSHHLI